ncbi:Type 1 glutamine amidotransferase-like domain-containing protein [Patescibacteria group bacterium]|nr:Type 1 glutamine amidotransferase-like domain-containing protein [Patescibacteria group bacterium]
MILSLFGGGIVGRVPTLLEMIYDEIRESLCKQVLLIPFAREVYTKGSEWHENWYSEFFSANKADIKFFDASNDYDLEKADCPLIYLSGGKSKQNLLESINASNKLKHLVFSAKHIIAESGGAMVLGEYCRSYGQGSDMAEGLGILKDTIMEPHYFEQERKSLLLQEITKYKCTYGLGIDSNSGVRINTESGYENLIPLGEGKYELLQL